MSTESLKAVRRERERLRLAIKKAHKALSDSITGGKSAGVAKARKILGDVMNEIHRA